MWSFPFFFLLSITLFIQSFEEDRVLLNEDKSKKILLYILLFTVTFQKRSTLIFHKFISNSKVPYYRTAFYENALTCINFFLNANSLTTSLSAAWRGGRKRTRETSKAVLTTAFRLISMAITCFFKGSVVKTNTRGLCSYNVESAKWKSYNAKFMDMTKK